MSSVFIPSRHKHCLQQKAIQVWIGFLILFALPSLASADHEAPSAIAGLPLLAHAAKFTRDQVPAGFELYSKRPNILSVSARAHPELPASWKAIKRAQYETIAMLTEMYPDHHLYFLYRDSDKLEDTAKLVSERNPALAKRIHGLNVSTANMKADGIMEYLAQEGISEKALKAGKKVLFIDTGYSGTIPQKLESYFPAELSAHFKTHLLTSGNARYPSARVFLAALNPSANSVNPAALRGTTLGYEGLPKYAGRSTKIAVLNGRVEPLSLITPDDKEISPEASIAYMEDLRADFARPESQKAFADRALQWRNLHHLSSEKPEVIGQKLSAFLRAHPSDHLVEAMVRDYVAMVDVGYVPGIHPHSITVESVGLKPVLPFAGGSNKNQLKTENPEWRNLLESPQDEIQKLIKAEDFGKLGALTDVVHDQEFFEILSKVFGKTPPSAGTRDFLKMLIAKRDEEILQELDAHTFGGDSRYAKELADLRPVLAAAAVSACVPIQNIIAKP